MKSSIPLHFKTYILIFLVVIFGPVGNLLLGKGMKRVGPVIAWTPPGFAHFLALVLRSGVIWLGIGCLMAFFIAYTLVLSRADYSYVQPASAIAYGMAAVLGHFVLGEIVNPLQWTGILIICLGVFVVGRTPPRTTGSQAHAS